MRQKIQNNWLEQTFLKTWHPYVWVILIGFLLYSQTLFFDFSYLDDNNLILDNYPFLSNPANFFKAFKEDVFFSPTDAYYRPLLTVSLMLDAIFGKENPFFYHFSNIIIHLLASSLVFLLFLKMNYRKHLAFFFSLIFTIHPVLTQAVSWVPGRNDSLLLVFVLAAFICFLNFLETKKWKFCFWHLFFFTLALFTKETAFILILICLLWLCLIVKEKIFSFNKKILLASWLPIIIFWLLLRGIAFKNPLPLILADITKSLSLNFPAVLQFIGKIFLPFNLSVFPIMKDTSFIYGFVSLAFLTILLALTKNKRSNFIIFGLVWFLAFLLPSFIRPNPDIVADFIEHRIYLPIIGIIIVLLETDLVKFIAEKKKSSLLIACLIIISLSTITFIHSRNFRNRTSFWENAAKTSPHSPLARRNLGAMYYLDGLLDKAAVEYQESLKLNPLEPMAHNNLALIYMDKGMFEDSEEEFKRELEINPFYDNAHFNLGLLYYKEGRLEEAQNLWQKTIEINPYFLKAYENLALYYYEKKNYVQSLYYFGELQKKGVQIPPELLESLETNQP